MKVIDDIIEEFAPEHTEFVCSVLGQPIRFRVISGGKELKEIKAGGKMFAETVLGALKDPPTKAVPEEWKPFLTDDIETLGWVNTMAVTCLEEGASHLDFLKLQKRIPVMFDSLKSEIAEKQLRLKEANDVKEIGELKND